MISHSDFQHFTDQTNQSVERWISWKINTFASSSFYCKRQLRKQRWLFRSFFITPLVLGFIQILSCIFNAYFCTDWGTPWGQNSVEARRSLSYSKEIVTESNPTLWLQQPTLCWEGFPQDFAACVWGGEFVPIQPKEHLWGQAPMSDLVSGQCPNSF